MALIRDNDSRDDLKNAAKMYAGSLERLLPKLKDAGEKAPTPAPAAAPVVVLAPEKVPPPALPWYCLLVQMLCLFVVQASAGERRGGGREPEKPKAREPSPAAPAPAKPPAASTPKPSAVKVRVYFSLISLAMSQTKVSCTAGGSSSLTSCDPQGTLVVEVSFFGDGAYVSILQWLCSRGLQGCCCSCRCETAGRNETATAATIGREAITQEALG